MIHGDSIVICNNVTSWIIGFLMVVNGYDDYHHDIGLLDNAPLLHILDDPNILHENLIGLHYMTDDPP